MMRYLLFQACVHSFLLFLQILEFQPLFPESPVPFYKQFILNGKDEFSSAYRHDNARQISRILSNKFKQPLHTMKYITFAS